MQPSGATQLEGEVNKFFYREILNRMVAKFINIEESGRLDFDMHRGYLRYNPKLRCIGIGTLHGGWWQWFRLLPNILNDLKDFIYIVFVGYNYTWLYEGLLPELIEILYQGSPIGDGNCYIISKKYEWLVGYSDDDDYVTCVDDGSFFDMAKIVTLDEQIKICLHLNRMKE